MKKAVKTVALLSLCAIACTAGFVGCAPRVIEHNMAISVENSPTTDIGLVITVSSYEQYVKDGESTRFEFSVMKGYDYTKIETTLNGAAVTMTATYEDGTEIGEVFNYDSNIKLSYTVESVKSDITFVVDGSNCVKHRVEITVADELIPSVKYCTRESSDETITQLIPETNVSAVSAVPSSGKLSVEYMSDVFLLINNNGQKLTVGEQEISPTTIAGTAYKYDNAYVYHIKASRSVSCKENTEGAYKATFNSMFTLGVLMGYNCDYYIDADDAQSADYVVDGTGIKRHASYVSDKRFYLYNMYIGDADTAADDSMVDTSYNFASKKLYLKLDFPVEDVENIKAYLMSEHNGQANKQAIDIVTVDGACFVVLTQDDVSQYVTQKNGIKSGAAFLQLEYAQAYLSENYVGVKINYSGDDYALYSVRVADSDSKLCVSDGQSLTFYFDKTADIANSLTLRMPSLSDYMYQKAEWTATYANHTDKGSEEFATRVDRVNMDIKLTEYTAGQELELSVTATQAPYDSSEHALNFSQMTNGKQFYVSNDLTVPLANWKTITNETATGDVVISSATPLFMVADDVSGYSLYHSFGGTITTPYDYTDLTGKRITVKNGDEQVQVYYINLESDYYEASIELMFDDKVD